MSVAELTCPFCDSPDVELVSAWGAQLITSQLRCRHCSSHFEAVRDDFDAVLGDRPGPRADSAPVRSS